MKPYLMGLPKHRAIEMVIKYWAPNICGVVFCHDHYHFVGQRKSKS